MSKPMLIRRSPLTGEWYAFTAYEIRPIIDKKTGEKRGEYLRVTGKRWDVTDQINMIMFNAKNRDRINRGKL
jgi:hypothetical protein